MSGVVNLSINIGAANQNIDWANILAVLLSAIISSIVSMCIANKNNKNQNKIFQHQVAEQQKQWLNAPYIQREADILINFREMVYNAKSSFLWFSTLLKPYLTYMKMFPEQDVKQPEDKLVIKFEDYCKHYDILNDLNDFYNRNQMILKKHDIEEEFVFITAILSTSCWLKDTNDFRYNFISEDDNCVKYKLDIIDTFTEFFVNSIEFQKNSNYVPTKVTEQKLQQYGDDILRIYFELCRKLDELTTFYNGDLPENLKMKSFKSFPNSNIIKNNRNK